MKHVKTFSAKVLGALVVAGAALGSGNFITPTAADATKDVTSPLPANERFASEINSFQNHDKKRTPRSGAVLFIGSSSVRLWDTLKTDFAEIPVINRGFGGSDISDSVQYADRIAIPYKPKMIVLFAGTNDIGNSRKSPAKVLADFQAFANKIHQALPETRVAFISISPTPSRWKHEAEILEANYLIQRWIFENSSPTKKLAYLDTHSQLLTPDGQPRRDLILNDGLHLNAKGYAELTSIIKPRILALAAMDGIERLDAATPKGAKQ